MKNNYEAVIGLEVHAQVQTDTKIFCGCSTIFGSPPNTNVCPVCLGHPGVLPVLNKKAAEYTALMGLATNCTINLKSVFARKNYFYPDLPKGYQVSQFETPVCENGFLEITPEIGAVKRIRILRIHLEEDAGKSIHDLGDETLIDLNRCGVPLMEIVSEPDLKTPNEAVQYLSKLKQILTYLHICDGNMEEGSLRCDANISVRKKGIKKLGTKTELKNMNSFRNVEKALEFEIERQIDELESGGIIKQETLLWDADQNKVLPMRGKEESHDYRYFPEPDLLPFCITEEILDKFKKEMPELPDRKKKRFINNFNLPEYDSEILASTRELGDYYEKVISVTADYKSASNWVMSEVLRVLKEKKIDITEFIVSPEKLGELINLINNDTISGKIAKDVFTEMMKNDARPEFIIEEKNLRQITNQSDIENIVDKILINNPEQVSEYRSGKEKVLGYFVGQVMKESKGKANPQIVNTLLKERLKST